MAMVPNEERNSFYGYCEVNNDYIFGIGVAIILSRLLLVISYTFVYFFIGNKNLRNGNFISDDLKNIKKKIIFHCICILISFALFKWPQQVLVVLPFVIVFDVINDWYTNFPGRLNCELESNATNLSKDLVNLLVIFNLGTKQNANDANDIKKLDYEREKNITGYIISHVEIILEKLGSLVVLVLGETIIALLFDSYNTNKPIISYLSIICSYFLIVSIAIMVYDSVIKKEIIEYQRHPIFEGNLSRLFFTVLSCTLCMSLLVSTSGLEYLYHLSNSVDFHSESFNTEDDNRFKLAMGQGVALIVIWLLSLSHLSLKVDAKETLTKNSLTFLSYLFNIDLCYVIIGLFHIFAYKIRNIPTDYYILMQLCISIALNSIRLIYRLRQTAAKE